MPTAYRLPRLRDRIGPGVRVLFVGINPGMRSARTGHHFAGYSNRFWRLLTDSRLVPEPVTFVDDDRLPHWGLGITNIVARATPGIGDLTPAEFVAGARRLLRKVQRHRPRILALVGVTVWRALLQATGGRSTQPIRLGLQGRSALGGTLARALPPGTCVFVLPNPSGRNANYTYEEMLRAYRALARHVARIKKAVEPPSDVCEAVAKIEPSL
jgi:mismatch-specific thymine-DNA glycosylase